MVGMVRVSLSVIAVNVYVRDALVTVYRIGEDGGDASLRIVVPLTV